jgi:hypothetical protein
VSIYPLLLNYMNIYLFNSQSVLAYMCSAFWSYREMTEKRWRGIESLIERERGKRERTN